MEGTQLRYVIKFVADMDRAVKFHRDVLGLRVKIESPGWSEFVTGETTLALHPASDKNSAGKLITEAIGTYVGFHFLWVAKEHSNKGRLGSGKQYWKRRQTPQHQPTSPA